MSAFPLLDAARAEASRLLTIGGSCIVERPRPDGTWDLVGAMPCSVTPRSVGFSRFVPHQAMADDVTVADILIRHHDRVLVGDRMTHDGQGWIVGKDDEGKTTAGYRALIGSRQVSAVGAINMTFYRGSADTVVGPIPVQVVFDQGVPRQIVGEAAVATMRVGWLITDANVSLQAGDRFSWYGMAAHVTEAPPAIEGRRKFRFILERGGT